MCANFLAKHIPKIFGSQLNKNRIINVNWIIIRSVVLIRDTAVCIEIHLHFR